MFWHCYFAVLAVMILIGVRLTRRMLAILLALPLVSVSALAWTTSNPFNGTVFALAGAVLGVVGIRLERGDARPGSFKWLAPGALLFLFGWSYPHFLATESLFNYVYAAPLGLIPCPTLSIVLAVTLMARGLDSLLWSSIAGALSILYGVFGAMILRVSIDWILLCGGIAVLVMAWSTLTSRARHTM